MTSIRTIALFGSLVLVATIAGYKHLPGLLASATEPTANNANAADQGDGEFTRVQRPGSVDLKSVYDLDGLTIPEEEIHTLLPRDAIPALTDPKTSLASESDWLDDEDRLIVVEVNNQRYAVPLDILDWHEIVNTTVGGEPVAVTYCPLCDSATVFFRRVTPAGDDREPIVLEFGVSGALYNSNVLMYDRTHKGLWSQLGMEAVSGPLAGTPLKMLPVRLMRFDDAREAWPDMPVVNRETGHRRSYGRSAYASYFENDGLMVPVSEHGQAMPAKTLGVGVSLEGNAWFIPIDGIGEEGYSLETERGTVEIQRNSAGVEVTRAPEGVQTAQTFYYAWTAFYPHATITGTEDDANQEKSP